MASSSPASSSFRGSLTTTHLRSVRYGAGTLEELVRVMEDVLAQDDDDGGDDRTAIRAMVVTGKSLAKTPIVPRIEEMLEQRDAFAATFTSIRQHTPIDDLEAALEVIREKGEQGTPSHRRPHSPMIRL